MACLKVERLCQVCEVPPSAGRVRGVAFVKIGVEFVDYANPLEWSFHQKNGNVFIVPEVRGGWEQVSVTVPGYGNNEVMNIGYSNTLTYSEPFDPKLIDFYNFIGASNNYRVLFVTDLYVIDSREAVYVAPIAPVSTIDTLNEYVVEAIWRSRNLPRAYDKPPYIFENCELLNELEANYCPPPEPECAEGYGLFRFVVDGVTFPFTTSGQIIYVTAYGPACPIPLATAFFNLWYYQPLIVGDVHFTLADAINDYSIFLGALAPGSYATLDGNVVSVYINRDGWRFSRRGFANPDVCFANFGFCGFNDAGFDPPTFDIRVIQQIECCDTSVCEDVCGEPIYFDDPPNGSFISVLTGAVPYLMDVANSVPYQTITLDIGESVDLQAFLPGTPFDCCGPDDLYIFLEIGATTVPRNGTYTTPAGIKFELDETFLTITNNLVAPSGGSVNFLVRFSTCGASPILGLFTINYSDDVYCPFTFGSITKTPAGAITSNGFGAFDYDSIFGGGNCGIGTLTFTRTGGAVPPCCTGGEAVSIDVYEDGVNRGTLTGAAGTVLTPTVLTPKAILFTLVSTGTGGFIVQAEQNVCGLPAVVGQWALTYDFVLCGETVSETAILTSVPAPAVAPCVPGGYSFEINVANLSAGLTIIDVQALNGGAQPLGLDEEKIITLEWDDEAQQTVSFHAINADFGSAPVCCNGYVAPTPESYAIYQPASTLGGEHALNSAQTYPLDGYINNAIASTAPVNNNYFIPYTFVKTDVGSQDVLITLDRNNVAPASYAQVFHFYYDFCNQRKRLTVIVCNKNRMGKWAYNVGSATAQPTFRKQSGNIRGVAQTRKLSGCCYAASLGGLACSGTTCVPAAGYTVFTLTGETGIVYPAQSITFNGSDVNTKSFPVSADNKFSMQLSIPAGGTQFNGDIDFQWIYIENNSTLIANATDITMILTMERHDCGEVITRNYRLIIFPGFPAIPHPPIDGVPPN